MDTNYDFGAGDENRIAYIRSVDVAELPSEIRSQVQGLGTIYAVHSAEGERLALVRDRKLAFALARQHDLLPVTVH
ncbi:DUF1150 family protein [Roseovarius spongiae]|uniref:DUF1150 family protein n=1 Tax=Roseovarius spongiae TaxID=2320272 RepID=A0A3A8AWF7_9RHOB|nr:DUF1150 family protein [Roseovarius spongiae]RKF16067.1 DUF1150 family protein [Roseovarius spongiae]